MPKHVGTRLYCHKGLELGGGKSRGGRAGVREINRPNAPLGEGVRYHRAVVLRLTHESILMSRSALLMARSR